MPPWHYYEPWRLYIAIFGYPHLVIVNSRKSEVRLGGNYEQGMVHSSNGSRAISDPVFPPFYESKLSPIIRMSLHNLWCKLYRDDLCVDVGKFSHDLLHTRCRICFPEAPSLSLLKIHRRLHALHRNLPGDQPLHKLLPLWQKLFLRHAWSLWIPCMSADHQHNFTPFNIFVRILRDQRISLDFTDFQMHSPYSMSFLPKQLLAFPG